MTCIRKNRFPVQKSRKRFFRGRSASPSVPDIRKKVSHLWNLFSIKLIIVVFLSLLSDSNQRPRDYKSRALANWAKEAGGQATCIAPLQPTTFATFPSWRIRRELAVQDLPVLLESGCKGKKEFRNRQAWACIFTHFNLFCAPFPTVSLLVCKCQQGSE